MSRRVPVSRPPAARVVHYVDPSTPADLAYPLHPAQLAAKREAQRRQYLLWKARQEAIAARDRKVRRFWLGFGAVIGLVFLICLAVLGWLIWQALAALSLGLLAAPVLVVLLAAAAVGGHRCITVVQHWH